MRRFLPQGSGAGLDWREIGAALGTTGKAVGQPPRPGVCPPSARSRR